MFDQQLVVVAHDALYTPVDLLNVLLVHFCVLHLLLLDLVLEFRVHIMLHLVEPLLLFLDELVIQHFDVAFSRGNAAHFGLQNLF